MYSVIGVVTMYIAPLVTIIFCYSAIILEICKRVVDTGTLPSALFSPTKRLLLGAFLPPLLPFFTRLFLCSESDFLTQM